MIREGRNPDDHPRRAGELPAAASSRQAAARPPDERQEEGRRRRRPRRRLGHLLRRPDGAADGVLRHAAELFGAGPGKAQHGRGLGAERLRHPALLRHDRHDRAARQSRARLPASTSRPRTRRPRPSSPPRTTPRTRTRARKPTPSPRSAPRSSAPQQFALAAASLKQAWQDLPDITAVADNIIVEETEEGLNIVIADQEGRAMFPEGSKYPYEMTRKAIAAMAPLAAEAAQPDPHLRATRPPAAPTTTRATARGS